MKRFFIFLLFPIFFLKMGAQGYVPKVGETIMFYPLTEKAKQEFGGYDCFYDASKITSKGKYKFKSGYQYKCKKNGLTPFDEIEGKTFKVLKAENYMHEEKQENRIFLLFLSRTEDKADIVLRIPFSEKDNNYLTKNMIVEKIEENKARCLYINMPCIPIDYMEKITKGFKGKKLFYKRQYISGYSSKDLDIKEARLKSLFYAINKLPFESSKFNECIDIKFESIEFSPYLHPFAICSYQTFANNERTVKIPLTYVSGNTTYFNQTRSSNYLFEYLFTLKDVELKSILSLESYQKLIDRFVGKQVYYGLKKMYNYDGKNENASNYNAANVVCLKNNSEYILSEGTYKCLEFDMFRTELWDKFDVYAILEDSFGVKFRVPAKSIFSGTKKQREYFYKEHLCEDFQECFMLVDDAYAFKQEQRNLAILKEKEEKERYVTWVKKYGDAYAKFINGLSDMNRERFERLASKYGKATAKMMIEGKVKIGWNKQMCKESWGEPDDINRTTGSWGTHEQWVYGDIYCNYLYFENGILTTIQN